MTLATNRLRAVLLATTVALGFFAFAGNASGQSALIQGIQQELTDLGYNPGPPDGQAGKRTTAAVKTFQTEFRLEVTGDLDEATAAALGVPGYAPILSGEIYVLPDEINDISYQLRKRTHAELINYLYDLSQRSVSKINMDGRFAKTVVFVLDADLTPGDVVTTQFDNIRLDLPRYYENFYYEVEEDTPTEPLVIVNTVEAGWELQFTHRMFLNGVLVAEKRTRAAK